jgi:hypothetical protein
MITGKQWDAMTPEAQVAMVAECAKWKPSSIGNRWRMSVRGNRKAWTQLPPNYLNDLNAMHEAETKMTDAQAMKYHDFLYGTANGFNSLDELCRDQDGHPNDWHGMAVIMATAAQRAKAFVLAMQRGKR